MTATDLMLLVFAAVAALAALAAFLTVRGLRGELALRGQDSTRLEAAVRDEAAGSRREHAELAARQRAELSGSLTQFGSTLATQNELHGKQLAASLEQFGRQLEALSRRIDERQQQALQDERAARETQSAAMDRFGELLATQMKGLSEGSAQRMHELRAALDARLEAFAQSREAQERRFDERHQQSLADQRAAREELAAALQRFGTQLAEQQQLAAEANAQRMVELRSTVEVRLAAIQQDNGEKLEAMRVTVDEKLNDTLQKRLGESFSRVAERLEQVQRGLGEMQSLAADVGGLKRVLSNVKTRGTWGEVQLGSLLEQMLVAEQYAQNVATRPGSRDPVEYAIRLPGRDAGEAPVWLPIDAKFPREDYERLLDAQERADAAAAEEAGKQLENRIRLEAKTIRDKYVEPPHTTDFAILFLPTEGLYAEVLRRPGLAEWLQRECRVTVAGPTTLTALLNSLQMGFRTLAIQKRSSEVWTILGAVKTEFGKFGEVLAKTRKQLETVQNTIGDAETRTRQIERKLRGVEALPSERAQPVLGQLTAADDEPG